MARKSSDSHPALGQTTISSFFARCVPSSTRPAPLLQGQQPPPSSASSSAIKQADPGPVTGCPPDKSSSATVVASEVPATSLHHDSFQEDAPPSALALAHSSPLRRKAALESESSPSLKRMKSESSPDRKSSDDKMSQGTSAVSLVSGGASAAKTAAADDDSGEETEEIIESCSPIVTSHDVEENADGKETNDTLTQGEEEEEEEEEKVVGGESRAIPQPSPVSSSSPASSYGANRDRSRSELAIEHRLPNGTLIQVRMGDITGEDVDCVVNAANSQLAHGGGVAGALSRAAGYRLQMESNAYRRDHGDVATGQVAVTGAGDLMCSKVIHAVGPVWRGGNQAEAQLLRDAVKNSLIRANEIGCSSMSIPAISSGIFGFPKSLCAEIMIDCVLRFDQQISSPAAAPPSLRCVRFTNFDLQTTSLFENQLRSQFALTRTADERRAGTGLSGPSAISAQQMQNERFAADDDDVGDCSKCLAQLYPGPTPQYKNERFHPHCFRCPRCNDGLGADASNWHDDSSSQQSLLPVCTNCSSCSSAKNDDHGCDKADSEETEEMSK